SGRGDLRPTALGPCGPIARAKGCEQRNKITERDKRQRPGKGAWIATRCILYFALHGGGIVPTDIVPERDRNSNGETTETLRVFRCKRLPRDVSNARDARERHGEEPEHHK